LLTKEKTRKLEIVVTLSPVAWGGGVLAMQKLSDPFESGLFVGLFYNAEREDRGFQSRSEEKKLPEALRRWLSNSEHLVRWILRNGSSYVRRLIPEEEKQTKTLTPECHHLNAASNECTNFEFRPLTQEEKGQFLNSLNAEGKRMLAELEGKRKSLSTRRSRKPAAQVVDSDVVSIAPNTQITPAVGNGTIYTLEVGVKPTRT
jgi:hypothetical protein